MIEINLNQTVYVKLTTAGVEHYRNLMTTEPSIDQNGYYRCGFWQLMHYFGSVMSMDLPPPFEMIVLVEELT